MLSRSSGIRGRPAARRTRFSGTSRARARNSARPSLMKLVPPERAMRLRVSGGITQREKRAASPAVRASSQRRRRTRSCRSLPGIPAGYGRGAGAASRDQWGPGSASVLARGGRECVAAALDEPLVPVDELDARPADLLEDDSAQLPEFAVSVLLPCAP